MAPCLETWAVLSTDTYFGILGAIKNRMLYVGTPGIKLGMVFWGDAIRSWSLVIELNVETN